MKIMTTAATYPAITTRPATPLREVNRVAELTAEENLARRIFQDGHGKSLIKFCRELAGILIRGYRSEGDAGEIRQRLAASLMETLRCSEKQALCLVELALELIHAKIHGKYRRSEADLACLIATATGAVQDVSAN